MAVIAVRPEGLLREMPITKYDFIIRDDSTIRKALLDVGFKTIRGVEVIEEPQLVFGREVSLSSIVYCAQK